VKLADEKRARRSDAKSGPARRRDVARASCSESGRWSCLKKRLSVFAYRLCTKKTDSSPLGRKVISRKGFGPNVARRPLLRPDRNHASI
jgi:hypothetical protein